MRDALALADLRRQLPQLAVDEREEDGLAGRLADPLERPRQAVDGGDPRMPDERRRMRRELRLGGARHPRGGVTRRVGDQVDLDRVGRRHQRCTWARSPTRRQIVVTSTSSRSRLARTATSSAITRTASKKASTGSLSDAAAASASRLAAGRGDRLASASSLRVLEPRRVDRAGRLVGALGGQPVAARERVQRPGELVAVDLPLQAAGPDRRTPTGSAGSAAPRAARARSTAIPSAASTASTRSSTNCSTASTVSVAPSESCAPGSRASRGCGRRARRGAGRAGGRARSRRFPPRRGAGRTGRASRSALADRERGRERVELVGDREQRARGRGGSSPPAASGRNCSPIAVATSSPRPSARAYCSPA